MLDFQVLQPFLVSDLCGIHRFQEWRKIVGIELRDIVSQRALLTTQVVQKWESAKIRRTDDCDVRNSRQDNRLDQPPAGKIE